jgi:HAD superfamily hydrolase (TIGR01509 family)
MIKAIILDMDGTMFDTEPLWKIAFQKSGHDLGYNITEEIHTKTIGSNQTDLNKILENEFGEEFPFEEFSTKYVENMKSIIEEYGVSIKPGLKELLDYLINNNYQIAIASSSSLMMIKNNLKKANIDENIFKTIVSGENFINGKPNPEIFLKTCELLNVEPQDTIVIEDSNNGIKAAFSAGCIPILIPDVDRIKEEVKSMAKYELNSLLEVIDLLETKK